MTEPPPRSSEDREAARRDRANRRARKEGRPEPYTEPVPAAAEEAEPLPVTDAPPLPVADPPPASDAPPPSADRPTADRPSPTDLPSDPEPLILERQPPPPPDAPSERASDPLIAPRDPAADRPAPDRSAPDRPAPDRPAPDPPASTRPIKSFPSPPDPEFYAPDDELEVPSGTRRVSRASRIGHRSHPARPPRRPHRGAHVGARRPRRWLGRIIALIALLLAAAVIWVVVETFQVFGTSPHGQVTVTIPQSTGASQTARLLQRDGVIGSRTFFELRMLLDGDRSKIRAGTYHLQRGMSYGAVLKALTTAPKAAKTSQVTIAEGHTRQYVAALLKHQHVRGDYLALTRHSTLLNPRTYGAPKSTDTLEGFLFPDTFTLVDPIQAKALVHDQLIDFKRRFATVDLKAACPAHATGFQVLTIASLIEAEAASPADDRLVASVICNRLRDHMMLQLDSTARYATGNFTKPLTVTQLASRSPYNTHTHFGLPPGPIDSPGLTAIQAAAHPASSDYLYFFSKPCTTRTVFASSYAQFENLLIRDRRNHCPH